MLDSSYGRDRACQPTKWASVSPAPDRRPFTPGLAFHLLTPLYDRATDLLGFGRPFRDRTIKALRMEDGEAVLDVGCGTGTLLARLAARYPHALFAGIDADRRMLDRARARLAGNPRIELMQAYAQSLPFPDGAFDAAVSTLIFHHLTPRAKPAAIAEISRVLKPSGRFLLADFGPPESVPQRALLTIASLFDGIENMRANLEGRLPQLLEQAGFRVTEPVRRFRAVQFLLAYK